MNHLYRPVVKITPSSNRTRRLLSRRLTSRVKALMSEHEIHSEFFSSLYRASSGGHESDTEFDVLVRWQYILQHRQSASPRLKSVRMMDNNSSFQHLPHCLLSVCREHGCALICNTHCPGTRSMHAARSVWTCLCL